MQQSPGFVKDGEEHLVCRLRKYLYGLKQAPRAWYSKINEFCVKNVFKKSKPNPDVYVKLIEDEIVIIVLYVGDLIIIGDSRQCIDDRKLTLRYIFHLGSRPISWSSKKQSIVTLSST